MHVRAYVLNVYIFWIKYTYAQIHPTAQGQSLDSESEDREHWSLPDCYQASWLYAFWLVKISVVDSNWIVLVQKSIQYIFLSSVYACYYEQTMNWSLIQQLDSTLWIHQFYTIYIYIKETSQQQTRYAHSFFLSQISSNDRISQWTIHGGRRLLQATMYKQYILPTFAGCPLNSNGWRGQNRSFRWSKRLTTLWIFSALMSLWLWEKFATHWAVEANHLL